jgi:hypothetical protein
MNINKILYSVVMALPLLVPGTLSQAQGQIEWDALGINPETGKPLTDFEKGVRQAEREIGIDIDTDLTPQELEQRIQECRERTANTTNPFDEYTCDNMREDDRHFKELERCSVITDIAESTRCGTEENLRHSDISANSSFANATDKTIEELFGANASQTNEPSNGEVTTPPMTYEPVPYIAEEDVDTKEEYQRVCSQYPSWSGCMNDVSDKIINETCDVNPDLNFCPITAEDNTNTEDEDEDDNDNEEDNEGEDSE